MGKIFYIMGKSSSGKDTIFKHLLDNETLHLKTIVPYTTRPIRVGESDGTEYFFTDEAGLQDLERQGKVIEVRSYDTYHGVWKYFTVSDNQIDFSRSHYLLIGTLESYVKTREFFGKENVVPILVDSDDGIRLQRALNREKKQKEPKYEEMCRRFLADSQDFSNENIEQAGITKRFYNTESLSDCLEEIGKFIKKYLSEE